MTGLERTPAGPAWITLATHRYWLVQQSSRLFGFFENAVLRPDGGFHGLDVEGRPLPESVAGRFALKLHKTGRLVHCFAIGSLLGRPGAHRVLDAGMEFLWRRHRDARCGGYLEALNAGGVIDETKQAYGHAFVLLAAASAKAAGHPEADRLLADILEVLERRFWDEGRGAAAEGFGRDWDGGEAYRGQNSNMHLAEALMGAFEATGEGVHLARAERIAELIIGRFARETGWRIPEHYDPDWRIDRAYSGSPHYRPFGTTPGHSFEWSRLLMQMFVLGGHEAEWMRDAARALFLRAAADAWGAPGGFCYTLDWDGRPLMAERYWWPHCEAIGAASVLGAIGGPGPWEEWYRRVWNFVSDSFIDRSHGGWHSQVDERGRPSAAPSVGKGDIYHSLQACLMPLFARRSSIVGGLREDGLERF